MCGSAADDPSMHDREPVKDFCLDCGEIHVSAEVAADMGMWTPGADEEWSYDHEFVSSRHSHPNVEDFVIGCPVCEWLAIKSEAQDQRRHQNY